MLILLYWLYYQHFCPRFFIIAEVYSTESIVNIKKAQSLKIKNLISKLFNIIIFIWQTPQYREQFFIIDINQFNFNNRTIKNHMVICNNNTQ